MDGADIAQIHREKFERQALERQLAMLPTGESAQECLDCGEPIPEDRRDAMPGCRFCLDCQEATEQRQKGRR